MRVLAVDFGSKRIGLAVGDTDTGIASPKSALTSIEGLKSNVEAIQKAVKRENADAVVVGVPLGENREETPMSKVCRRLAELIRQAGHQVFEVDESLTSVEAEARLREHDWTEAQRRKRRDGEAACLILERFFATYGKA